MFDGTYSAKKSPFNEELITTEKLDKKSPANKNFIEIKEFSRGTPAGKLNMGTPKESNLAVSRPASNSNVSHHLTPRSQLALAANGERPNKKVLSPGTNSSGEEEDFDRRMKHTMTQENNEIEQV